MSSREPVRLVVDASLLHRGGIGRYIREITSRWLVEESVERITFLGDREALEDWLADRDGGAKAGVRSWPGEPYSLARHASWTRELRRASGEADVTFFPHYDVPVLGAPDPYVVTVHDLTHFQVPEAFGGIKRWAGLRLLRRAVAGAGSVITVSEHSRTDLEGDVPRLRGRVRVIPNGVSEIFRPLGNGEREAALSRWSDLRPFLLFPGGGRPHKNLALAIELVRRLRSDGRPDLRLVVVGERGSEGALNGSAPPRDVLSFLGKVGDGELRELYAVAEAVVVPSLYEGFGLPVVEAMACGAPVLASDRASLPEVAGGVIPLLDPEAPVSWVSELRRLRSDRELLAERRARGLEWASTFSWERTADEVLTVLEEAGGGRSAAPRRAGSAA